MKPVIAIVLLGLALCIPALGQASRPDTNGTDLLHQCADYDHQVTKRGAADAAIEASEIGYGLGYCFGVINTAAEILQVDGEIQLPDGSVTFEQVKKVVMSYLDAHPEQWQKPASVVVTKALKLAWGSTTAK
jgi:Rap1a immunity proteins